jgi:O-antigen ligase
VAERSVIARVPESKVNVFLFRDRKAGVARRHPIFFMNHVLAIQLLTGLLFSLPFLIPIHRPPQAVFDAELVSSVLLCLLGMVIGLRFFRERLVFCWLLPVWLLLVILVAFAQNWAGILTYPEQAYFALIYCSAALIAYLVGAAIRQCDLSEAASSAVFFAVLFCGLLSVVIQLLQLFDYQALPAWMFLRLEGSWRDRPSANVGQANILATYLAWGLVACLAILQLKEKLVVRVILFLMAALLSVGITLTRSRTGLCFLFLIAALVWLPTALRMTNLADRVVFCIVLVVGYVAGSGLVAFALAGTGFDSASSLSRLTEQGIESRLVMWRDALTVSMMYPWVGVGFLDYASAQYMTSKYHVALVATPYVHNFILQTAVEMGWVIALGLVGILVWWVICNLIGRAKSVPMTAFVAMVALCLLHALVEWPLSVLSVLVPTCLMFAIVSPSAALVSISIDMRLMVLLTSLGIVFCVLSFLEFDELSTAQTSIERSTRSGNAPSDAAINSIASASLTSKFRPFAERILVLVQAPHLMDDSPEGLAMVRRSLWHGSDARIVTRLIYISAKAGLDDEAVEHLERLRTFHAREAPDSIAYLRQALSGADVAAPRLLDALNGESR